MFLIKNTNVGKVTFIGTYRFEKIVFIVAGNYLDKLSSITLSQNSIKMDNRTIPCSVVVSIS